MVVLFLVVAFVILPLTELWLIVEVGSRIGVPATFALLLVISVLGAWTVKRIGLGVWQRARATVQAGEVPAREMVDGTVVLMAGALMLVPGFITDACGLVLLLPPVRRLLGGLAARRLGVRTRATVIRVENTWSPSSAADVVDGELRTPGKALEP